MICVLEREYAQELTVAILDSKQFLASVMGSNSETIMSYYFEPLINLQSITARFHQEEHIRKTIISNG